MGGGGGGGNIFGDGNFFNGQNLGTTILNAAMNYATYGLVGFEDGKIGKGMLTRGIDEGVGELTGRNMQRKMLMESQDKVREEHTIRNQELADQQQQMQNADMQASNAATGRRSRGAMQSMQGMNPGADWLGV